MNARVCSINIFKATDRETETFHPGHEYLRTYSANKKVFMFYCFTKPKQSGSNWTLINRKKLFNMSK